MQPTRILRCKNIIQATRRSVRKFYFAVVPHWFSRLCLSSVYEVSFLVFLQLLAGSGTILYEKVSYWLSIIFYIFFLNQICSLLFRPFKEVVLFFEGYRSENLNLKKYISIFELNRVSFVFLLVFLQESPLL